MYLDHYGLKQPPFSITPDPHFVFLSARHREALAHLIYGISQGGGGGFVQLTGEVGTGKTTLSRLLLEQLPVDTRVALVLNPRLDPVQLLEAICEELRLDVEGARGDGKALVDRLNRFLLEAHARDERIVLILDEAQQLSVEALEQVRLLTNLETATHKLLQIVLLGQPELREMLQRPDLRQLAQRITARYHLTPLDAAETDDYVRHRLAVAGLTRSPFTPRGMRALHRRSGGIPRLINVIAERALLAGYARDTTRLDARLVDDAADELLPGRRPALRRRAVFAAAAGLVLAAAAIGIAWQLRGTPDRGEQAADAAPSTPAAIDPQLPTNAPPEQTVPAAPGAEALQAVFAGSRDDVATIALLLDRWQAGDVSAERLGACPFELAAGINCVRSRGTLAQLAGIDRPVLLLVPDQGELRPLALLALDAGTASVGADGRTVVVARSALESAWPGEYLALMRLPAPVATTPGSALPPWAREALTRFESNLSLPPLSDDDLRLQRLQQVHGLRADAIAGPETWWALSARLDGGPRLGAAGPAAPDANR